jgi:2',3'-cyclic-nucleotide 2'-phosphodiesterase (5'-nucleotidase family)
VSYTYDPARERGARITSVTVDGEPLDAARGYRIGTFSFLAQGGDNFAAFKEGTDVRDSGLVDRDAWIAYLKANSRCRRPSTAAASWCRTRRRRCRPADRPRSRSRSWT